MERKRRRQHQTPDPEDEESILVLNRQRCRPVDRRALLSFARCVLDELGQSGASATITLVSDRTIRTLNRTYRDTDRSTDVLAFPDQATFAHERRSRPYLGDVIISVETADRYARRFRISFDRELRNLIIHGLLHLCGYDHETDQGQMKRLERRLRRRLMGGRR